MWDYSMRQGPDGKKCVALGTFSFVLESEKCGCQPRNAMNGMGCTGEAGETSKAGQFLRLHHSTRKRLYIHSFLWATGSQCNLINSGEACVRLDVLKMSLAEQFWSFSMSCWGIPDKKRVTVVKTWQYHGCDKGVGGLNCENMSNWANSTQLQVGRLTHLTNLFHRELVIENHA